MNGGTFDRPRLAGVAALLSAACFALYAGLAARDVMFGDGPELTAAAILNGVAHPPGYPIWIVLGHLASLLPLGTLAFRINLTACAYHALAVGLVYMTAFVLTRRQAAALFAAVVLAIGSPLFVSWSLQAEVFSLNDLFAAAIVLLCIVWLDDPHRWHLIVPLGLLFGLGMSNQQTLLLLAPVPIWVAWCGRRAIPLEGRTFATLACAFVGLVVGFALPFVHTLAVSRALSGWHFGAARTLPELVGVILRRVYGPGLVAGAADQGGNVVARAVAMVAAMGWPFAFVAGGTAALAAAKRWRPLGVAILLLAVPWLAFCAVANIGVTDELLRSVFVRFALLPLVALAPFSACAFTAIVALFRAPAAQAAATTLVFAAAIVGAVLALPELSLAGVHNQRTLYRDIFDALPPHAILLTAGDPVDQPARYFQDVEHWRPDVTIVTYGLLNIPAYATALGKTLTVPSDVLFNLAPQARRDLLVAANPGRPFYVVGERGIHAPGPRYRPSVTGIVSHMIANDARVDLHAHYREEVRLQSAPGYADVPADRWRSNGFAAAVREYYAGGFFSTGYDAERLRNVPAARHWYERAEAYYPDALIAQRIQMLSTLRSR